MTAIAAALAQMREDGKGLTAGEILYALFNQNKKVYDKIATELDIVSVFVGKKAANLVIADVTDNGSILSETQNLLNILGGISENRFAESAETLFDLYKIDL